MRRGLLPIPPGARSERAGGFTLIELMIVVAIIAIIAAIAIPNLMAARLRANETSAVSTMRTISTAQSQFHMGARVDVDSNGVGEYGLFRELTGTSGLRTSADASTVGEALRPAVLSRGFGILNSDGEVTRSGFHFKVYLPNGQGRAVSERSLTVLEAAGSTTIDSGRAENLWCAYAWPMQGGSTGTHTFFINQRGDITHSERAGSLRSGPNGIEVTEAGFAFAADGGHQADITGNIAYGVPGRDGEVWRRVN